MGSERGALCQFEHGAKKIHGLLRAPRSTLLPHLLLPQKKFFIVIFQCQNQVVLESFSHQGRVRVHNFLTSSSQIEVGANEVRAWSCVYMELKFPWTTQLLHALTSFAPTSKIYVFCPSFSARIEQFQTVLVTRGMPEYTSFRPAVYL